VPRTASGRTRLHDLSGYDLVVSNSHTIAKGARTTPRQLHICYLETPMRFAWDLEEYYLRQFRQRGPRRLLARAVFARMRRWDLRTAPAVDEYVALSRYVADRCRRVYGRAAHVLPPPVRTDFFTPADGVAREGYLAASRLTPFKNVGLIVEAFRAMPERRLAVIGDGPEYERIRARCPANVTMLGLQEDAALREHMRRARAFLFAAPEDFGIVMAEAQACGTPVIALGEGGALEIVRGADSGDPTGVFFREATARAVVGAVTAFESGASRITAAACRARAMRFTEENFRAGWMAHVQRALASRSAA
jgi:glycosyltransferase involved in cell wall biosynthesis